MRASLIASTFSTVGCFLGCFNSSTALGASYIGNPKSLFTSAIYAVCTLKPYYVDMSVWLFVGKQYYRLDVSTNSNDIPTKFRKYGQYLYSTNTARVSLFSQNHVLSSSTSKTLHSYKLFLKLGIIHI